MIKVNNRILQKHPLERKYHIRKSGYFHKHFMSNLENDSFDRYELYINLENGVMDSEPYSIVICLAYKGDKKYMVNIKTMPMFILRSGNEFATRKEMVDRIKEVVESLAKQIKR